MTYLTGAAAAAICFMLNRALFQRIGYRTVISWSPVIEEFFKSVPAYFMGIGILPVHVVFGVIEGVYEWKNCRTSRYLPLLLSIVGHSLFGLTAMTILFLADSIFLAVAGAAVIHLLWNISVVKFF